jgi:hypothetical protein
MDLNRKRELAENQIISISQHGDADSRRRIAHLNALKSMIDAEIGYIESTVADEISADFDEDN